MSEQPGVVAFCAPGSEMLAAVTCNLYGMGIDQVIADPDLTGDDLIVANLASLGLLRADSGPTARYWLRLAMARVREEAGRREWIEGVKERLGLVTIDDISAGLHDAFIGDPGDEPKVFDGFAAAIEWPAGIPDGQWEVVSDHVLELPAGWPPGCRCVLADGERVSLGGPCPVEGHYRVRAASWCPCGHDEDDICLNGDIYGNCGDENCGGGCDPDAGTCRLLPGCCAEEPA